MPHLPSGRGRMDKNKRVPLREILKDPDRRRELMISTIQATQAREGIRTSEKQASRAYFVVSEAERATFLDLTKFRGVHDELDKRHEMFVRAIRGDSSNVRFDVPRRDFHTIDGAPLAYRRLSIIAVLFRENPSLVPTYGDIKIGHQTFDDERFVRTRWEVPEQDLGPDKTWVRFAKGGEFSRFYADVHLAVRWDDAAHAVYATRKSNFNVLLTSSSSQYLHRAGLTWPLAATIFNVRLLPSGCIFGQKGPAIFPVKEADTFFLAAILNSELALFTLKGLTSREDMGGRWEAGVVRRMPIARPNDQQLRRRSALAQEIIRAKSDWDTGTEISGAFVRPWILDDHGLRNKPSLDDALSSVLSYEQEQNDLVQESYLALNTEIYAHYGIRPDTVNAIRQDLGQPHDERVWPQMRAKTAQHNSMQHVWRLLSYRVKRIVETDKDGIVPYMQVSDKVPLLERVRAEFAHLLADRDLNAVEVEIVNELKRKVNGYDRADTIQDWLENVFFAYHVALYKGRPIFWHISSSQGKKPAAFAALVHYHRFDKEGITKLRST